ENDGMHIRMPSPYKSSRGGMLEANNDYASEIQKISSYLSAAKTYNASAGTDRNLVLEAGAAIHNGSQTLFIHANLEKQIIDGIQMAVTQGVKSIVGVGGYKAHEAIPLLKKHQVGVLVRRVHDLPMSDEQDVDMPYRLASILTREGILVGLENSGDMERMN